MSPQTSRNRNAVSSVMPGMSNDRAAGDGRVSRSTSSPTVSAISPTGTFT